MISRRQFELLAGIKLTERDGKLVHYGDLNLRRKKYITELVSNLKVVGSLDLSYSGVVRLSKGLEVARDLDISGTYIKKLREDTKIGRSLLANRMKNPFSFPKVVNLGHSLECNNTTIKQMPKEVHAHYGCEFNYSKFSKLPKMEVDWCLYLKKTNIKELPEDNKEFYGIIDIAGTKVAKLRDNLVVHGDLRANNTPIKELSRGLIVGEGLDLCDTNLSDYSNLHKICPTFEVTTEKYKEIKKTLAKHSCKSWFPNADTIEIIFEPNYKGAYLFENEDNKYLKADDIFVKILKQEGNVYYTQYLDKKYTVYFIVDEKNNWGWGYSLEKAKADLLYKASDKNKNIEVYKKLTLSCELTFEEASVCYRIIAGTDALHVKDFINDMLEENRKDKYTIQEIINMTKGGWDHTSFRKFFMWWRY